jgi:hypothetical protein
MRIRYWSCSPIANWVRGTDKPSAETSLGWAKWRKASKEKYPIRYWIAERGLDYLQNFLCWPADRLYDVKYYINNRWVTKTHCLTAHPRDIARGQWRDVGYRFLPCLFNELVDFVEVELAWFHIAWDKEAQKKYKAPFYSWGWFRWRTWRSAQAGLDNLNWQRNLVYNEEDCEPDSPNIGKPTYQAVKAEEILALYKWWTEVYPNRPDPHEASGWTAHCALGRARAKEQGLDSLAFLGPESETEEESAETRRILDLSDKIEKEQKDEDTEMMIRLINIRDSLWT